MTEIVGKLGKSGKESQMERYSKCGCVLSWVTIEIEHKVYCRDCGEEVLFEDKVTINKEG